jgi:hypothetical protein
MNGSVCFTEPVTQVRRNGDMAEKAYCVKCRSKSEMVEAKQVTMKNGRPAVQGKCEKCGTGMYKILSKK